MNEAVKLFQDIKSIFKSEGVEIETTKMTKEKPTETDEVVTDEIKETVKEKFEDITLADGSLAQVEPEVSLGS